MYKMMSTASLLLCLLVIVLASCSAEQGDHRDKYGNSISPPSILSFRGYSFAPSEAHPHAGVQTADGGFLVVGDGVNYANQTFVQRRIMVLKVNAEGEMEWSATHGYLGRNYGKFGMEMHDGTFLVAGAVTGTAKRLHRALLHYSKKGELLKEVLLPNDSADFKRDGFMCVAAGENENTIIASGWKGGENSTDGYPTEPMFLIGGGVSQVTKFTYDKGAFSIVFDVSIDAESAFQTRQGMRLFYDPAAHAYAVSHTTTTAGDLEFQFGMSLLAADDGRILWSRSYPATPPGAPNDTGHASHPYALTLARDGKSYAIGGLAVINDAQGIEQCQGRIAIIAPATGNLTYDRRFTSSEKDTNIECYGVSPTPDRGFILTCGTGVEPELHPKDSQRSKTWRVLVHRTDSTGSPLWEHVYTSNAQLQNNAGEFILTAKNGSYVVYVDAQSVGNPGTGGNFGIMMLGDDSAHVEEIKPSVSYVENTRNGFIRTPTPFEAWPPPPRYNATVKTIGTFTTAQECADACMEYNNTHVSPVSGWTRAMSFTFFANVTGINCFANVDEDEWNEEECKECTSGRISWPPSRCNSHADCSWNGKCSDARLCECSPAWTGDRCQKLALKAVVRGSGLNITDQNGQATSTWGGAVQFSDGKYHMWASEMLGYCGINSWTTNSHIIHAESASLDSPFVKTGEVWPAFAHEPNVVRAPTGEYVAYFTSSSPGAPTPKPCTTCKDGKTPVTCPGGAAGNGPTYMSVSFKGPAGPWSSPSILFSAQANFTNMDTNLAVTINDDGSVIGIGRTGGSPTGIIAHLVTASNWRDPASYKMHEEMLFENTTLVDASGVEDPFVYVDKSGIFHAIFHSQIESDDERLCGGHAYSADGNSWHFTGTSWSNRVTFEDGSTYAFSRRERPHFVFRDNTIVALTTSVQTPGPVSLDGQDASYTLLQKVRT